MENTEIIDLFFARSEDAIVQTQKKYDRLCRKIAFHILANAQDTEECINDAYFHLWNQIPPERPAFLQSYLCKIVRNTALHIFRKNHADKRFCEHTVCYSELEECIPDSSDIIDRLETKELTQTIEHFLDDISKEKRIMFVKRYFLFDSVKDIAAAYGISERHASVKLRRIRQKLQQYLQKEGWTI